MVKINLYNLQISITTKFLHQLRSRASLICVQFDYGLFLIDIVSSDNQGEIWVALKETKNQYSFERCSFLPYTPSLRIS